MMKPTNAADQPIPPRIRPGCNARIFITLIKDGAFYDPAALPTIHYTDSAGNAVDSVCVPLAGDAHANYFFDMAIASDAPEGYYTGSISFFDDLGNPCGSRTRDFVQVDPSPTAP